MAPAWASGSSAGGQRAWWSRPSFPEASQTGSVGAEVFGFCLYGLWIFFFSLTCLWWRFFCFDFLFDFLIRSSFWFIFLVHLFVLSIFFSISFFKLHYLLIYFSFLPYFDFVFFLLTVIIAIIVSKMLIYI